MYGAINAIAAALAREGLPKHNFNLRDDYFYRSIDDVILCLAPLLATHRLCILPRARERHSSDRAVPPNLFLCHVVIKIAFDLVSADDGSCHTVEAFGEALDENDKATAKATSAAYKSAMLQAFCIPVVGKDDPDRANALAQKNHDPAPVQGWDQWSSDIIDIIKSCQSAEALERVRNLHRGLLKALQRERPELYAAVGVERERRSREFAGRGLKESKLGRAPSRVRTTSSGARKTRAEETEHA